jgi:hypothetical protein
MMKSHVVLLETRASLRGSPHDPSPSNQNHLKRPFYTNRSSGFKEEKSRSGMDGEPNGESPDRRDEDSGHS